MTKFNTGGHWGALCDTGGHLGKNQHIRALQCHTVQRSATQTAPRATACQFLAQNTACHWGPLSATGGLHLRVSFQANTYAFWLRFQKTIKSKKKISTQPHLQMMWPGLYSIIFIFFPNLCNFK